MDAGMVDAPLTRATTIVLAYVRDHENIRLSALTEEVCREAALDEATVKAAVLRLSSEGELDITSDWTVRAVRNAAEAA
jgi:DNA-binding transcriptional regulator PaaX